MGIKRQKIILAGLAAISAWGGLEALIYIVNLNQPAVFFHTAFWIWIFLWLGIALLYDLHFKNPCSLARAKVKHGAVAHWLRRALKIFVGALKKTC